MNRIIKVCLILQHSGPMEGQWIVDVTKEFAPEHGGGTQIFQENGGANVHRALDVARGMVTVHPGQRVSSSTIYGMKVRDQE